MINRPNVDELFLGLEPINDDLIKIKNVNSVILEIR